MKLKIFILFISFFVSNEQLHAQNLIEQLGGVRTNFKFHCGMVDLEVKSQCIIKRAESGYGYTSLSDHVYGYGYESFHLEFETTVESDLNKTWEYGIITFYDANDNILSTKSLWSRVLRSGKNPWFYSVRLIDIPILILDNTSRIEIEVEVKQKDSNTRSHLNDFLDSIKK